MGKLDENSWVMLGGVWTGRTTALEKMGMIIAA
jgi:hypothetical protein